MARNLKSNFFSFEEAKKQARKLAIQTSSEYGKWSVSKRLPPGMPSAPHEFYKDEWISWGDFLGTRMPFKEAREWARLSGIRSKNKWARQHKLGKIPISIPSSPSQAYKDEWISWGDFLGTGRIADQSREYLTYLEAKAFIAPLKIPTKEKWDDYCNSGQKPSNIPRQARDHYKKKNEWIDWRDFLGSDIIANRNKEFPSYSEVREWARSSGIRSQQEWKSQYRLKMIPANFPQSPYQTYKDEWISWGDFLGTGRIYWKKIDLLSFLQDLRLHTDQLDYHDLCIILEHNKTLAKFNTILGKKSLRSVLEDIKENNARDLETALKNSSDQIVESNQLDAIENEEIREEEVLTSLNGNESSSNDPDLPMLATKEGLRKVDEINELLGGLDEEVAEYLVVRRVNALWERYCNGEDKEIAKVLSDPNAGYYFSDIRQRFLEEKRQVDMLPIPGGWSFTCNQGQPCPPNRMQLRIAWLIKEMCRYGNWSGVGSGKTLSAILASRVISARVTLIVTNYATIDGWTKQIRNAYPDSKVHFWEGEAPVLAGNSYHYIILNYEKFQRESRSEVVNSLLGLGIDFIVFDEVQFVKQRDEEVISNRSKALHDLVERAADQNPSLCVLGMSATPVINNLFEPRSLLKAVTGLPLTEVKVAPTINNSIAMHRLLMTHGIRHRPRYEQEMDIRPLPELHNELLVPLQTALKGILSTEQALLPTKLDIARPYFTNGALVYTHYVDGMIDTAYRYLEDMGLSVGLYTGSDKSGLLPFLKGKADILLGSSPVGTGLDELQKVCDRLVILCLPWTNAAYEQVIGRILRQGSNFKRVEIIIPQVTLEHDGEIWSWDKSRLACIKHKRTLSDCALDGAIPDTININQQEFLRQCREALDQWIARVSQESLVTVSQTSQSL